MEFDLLATTIKSISNVSGSMRTSPASDSRRKPGRPAKSLDASESALAQFGAELRRIRLERQLTLIRLGELTGYSWQHLGNVERAQVTPSESVVTACEGALSAGGRLAALLPAVVRAQASQRHTREATRHSRPSTADNETDWSRLAAAATRPATVTTHVVDELEAITDRQRSLYHELTSAQLSVPVEAHLGLLTTLLEGAPSNSLQHRIASAASEAAGFAAWIWHDLGDPFKSTLFYRAANRLLPAAANPALSSYISGYRALACEANGLFPEAIRHAEAALQTAPRTTTQLTRSWLCAVSANALATIPGRQDDTRALLDQAQDHFDAARNREEWMYEFDHTALAGYRGQCHLQSGSPSAAVTAFAEGLTALPTSCKRRGAQLTIGLAEAHLATGQLDKAVDAAGRALGVFADRGSASGLCHVRRFRDLLHEGGHHREANEMDERVHARLKEAR